MMLKMKPCFLKFEEQYMERIWGGTQLRRVLGKPVPTDRVIGESWMIADHPACESVVAEGPCAGRTLRQVMELDAPGLLGANASPTAGGRFPLLLKIIDAAEDLSVQVHPDDEQARTLGERDSGKTEMWHILGAEGSCEIALGFRPGITRDALEACLREGGDAAGLLARFPVRGGESIFVRAGMAHAIGAGALLAEIQQNSDITYRLFDYNRTDASGSPRELHLEKGLAVTRLTEAPGDFVSPLSFRRGDVQRELLTACRYFAAEKVLLDGPCDYSDPGRSFHILFCVDGALKLEGCEDACEVTRGEVALAPAAMSAWHVSGAGAFLDYYVPDLWEDVILPLRREGYSDAEILALGGPASGSDLEEVLQAHRD